MVTGFGQFCPLALASEVLTEKWMLLVLRELSTGSTRFNQIRRGVPRMSATLLKQRLEMLSRAGVVEQRDGNYILTDAGAELKPILSAIGTWGQRWARDIAPDDLDPGWLVWAIHRRLDTNAMPHGRTVIAFVFTDAKASHRRFWIVHCAGDVEVCLKPPGFESDITVMTGIRVFAEVWRGLRSFHDELARGRIRIEGTAALCRAFPSWLLLSAYAKVPRCR